MKTCDILLVVGYFRSAAPFLSLIRYLSKEHSVGVVFLDVGSEMEKKTGAAQSVFKNLCQDFGASVYLSSQSIAAKLMIVQQFVYPDDFALSVRNNIKAD
ncbi:MAG: hypothetical protein PHX61_13340, partial [Alphaproteobacteria bacterium]|nr:hypothetical protein [Alphaproteobacteria bacterium]